MTAETADMPVERIGNLTLRVSILFGLCIATRTYEISAISLAGGGKNPISESRCKALQQSD